MRKAKLPEHELIWWDWKDIPSMVDFTNKVNKGFKCFQYIPSYSDDNIVVATKKPTTFTNAQRNAILKEFYGE